MALLSPDSRKLLADALRPPDGCQLDFAVATTYSLDLRTLITAPLHMARFAAGSRTEALQDPIALLEAVQRAADKFAVFHDAERLHVPNVPMALYSLLEPVCIPVRAPRGGAFHPKLWLLRFTAETAPHTRLRLLVLSRNLTDDRSWDTVLWLDGYVSTPPFASNRALVDLLRALPDMAVNGINEPLRARMTALAEEVRYAWWEPVDGVDELRFDALGLDAQRFRPRDGRRLVVVSPFVEANALTEALRSTEMAEALVSRPESLDDLPAEVRSRFQRVLVLDEAAETESGEDPADQANILHGLHAKIVVAQHGWDTTITVGSANATNAAWLAAKNVEFVAQLTGKTSRLGGVDPFLGGDGFGKLLVPYVPRADRAVPDPADVEAEAVLVRVRSQLSDAGLRLAFRSVGADWEQTLTAAQPIDWKGVASARAWPVTLRDDRAADALPLSPGTPVRLGTLALAHLTRFIAFEITAAVAPRAARFVLSLPADGLPPDRDEALIRAVIQNRAGFLRYLMLLLGSDDLAHLLDGAGAGGDETWRPLGSAHSDGELPLLERLVRAWSHGRVEELRAIDRLVARLESSKDCADVLPHGFLDLWTAFRTVLAAESKRRDVEAP
jgi:hypothetical protein